MTSVADTPANQSKTEQLRRSLAELLDQVLRRGFFGTAGVEFTIQDGTIQGIRRRLEAAER